MNDNQVTTGMDGGDNAEWHNEQHEISGGMLWATVAVACALLALAAIVLAMWKAFA